MTDHRRDSDLEEYEHRREDDEIPHWLKWIFIAINRVGFPIVAFFFMWYISTVSLKKFSDALDRQSLSLEALIITVNSNHQESKEWRNQMLMDVRLLQGKIH